MNRFALNTGLFLAGCAVSATVGATVPNLAQAKPISPAQSQALTHPTTGLQNKGTQEFHGIQYTLLEGKSIMNGDLQTLGVLQHRGFTTSLNRGKTPTQALQALKNEGKIHNQQKIVVYDLKPTNGASGAPQTTIVAWQ
ncbi:MAG: hypothetical protein SFZ03_10915 [Candidatus Melainabacteria bacterium]|nr:hypothetical protein [Candidatus Melainabacteria bacterium]